MKYLMVIASYNDNRQKFFEEYMSPRNKEYCQQHGYEYLEIRGPLQKVRGSYTWLKFSKVIDLLNQGVLKQGDTLCHLDADMCIAKPELEYPSNKSFTYAIDSGNTHCMGNYCLKINDWSVKMVNLIMDEFRFMALNDVVTRHDFFGHYSSFWHEFREQASWYSLAGIKRHSNEPFWNLPNNGWHSDANKWTVYSLDELGEHVDVLPTEWNVTELESESECTFLINKVKKEDVIIRHFAGGQRWREEWFK